MANITNKDLYNAINDLRKEISRKIESVEEDVKINTNFRNQLIGKITVLMIVIGAGVNMLWDSVFNRK